MVENRVANPCALCGADLNADPTHGHNATEIAKAFPPRDLEADLRSIRALQGAPLEGCGDDDCDDCYPK